MGDLQPYIIATKTVTLVFGGLVTYFAARAYRRTGTPALRALAIGLGLVTTGGLLAGAIHQLADVSLEVGVAVQSTFTTLGFAVLAYSVYAAPDPDPDVPPDGRRTG